MAQIPQIVAPEPIKGLEHVSSGKVRDIYKLDITSLLEVASDRISIFDFVLSAFVPLKGQILTALNVFWRQQVLKDYSHDLISFGSGIDKHLPEELRGNPELQKRALVITRLAMVPIECVVRGYLTGSAWESYQKDGTICGHKLPTGLKNGSMLPYPIFTPATKAESGHDENITPEFVERRFGYQPERLSIQLYKIARRFAEQLGIILVDTKFELGFMPGQSLTEEKNFNFILGDEVLTPDSSRYWGFDDWKKAQRDSKLPPAFDKQFVREWGKKFGIPDRKPENPDDVAYVHSLEVPKEVLEQTTRLYRYIFWRLTGRKLEIFQRDFMGIKTSPLPVNIDIILGSRSDSSQVLDPISMLKSRSRGTIKTHIISCHRNPEELMRYTEGLNGVDVVIAAAGMAAQLPGQLKAWLDKFGKSHIPVIGVALKGETEEASKSAILSIEQLPGQPVELNNGRAYFDREGMFAACKAAIEHEFLPRSNQYKPAEFNIDIRRV